MMRWGAMIIAGITLCFGASANAQEPGAPAPLTDFTPPHLAAMNWLPHDDKLADRLTQAEQIDLRRSGSTLVEVGRMAFRYRGLLGGWAARNGLSCQSCHQGRRAAPVFIPAVSDRPGRVDLTHALFSEAAEDGIKNSKPIPPIHIAKADMDLRTYLTRKLALFDAPAPDKRIIEALARYIEAAQKSPSPTDKSYRRYTSSTQKKVRTGFDAILRAANVIDKAAKAGDQAILRFSVAAARAEMERVFERLDPNDRARKKMLAWNATLNERANLPLDENQQAQWQVTLGSFRAAMTAARDSIQTRADMTFYNREWLQQALTPPLLEPPAEETVQ